MQTRKNQTLGAAAFPLFPGLETPDAILKVEILVFSFLPSPFATLGNFLTTSDNRRRDCSWLLFIFPRTSGCKSAFLNFGLVLAIISSMDSTSPVRPIDTWPTSHASTRFSGGVSKAMDWMLPSS